MASQMAKHTTAVRRAYRTATLIWFICILPATLAVLGPTLAVGSVALGMLLWLPGLVRDPGRWWESTRQGLDLPTIGLAALLGMWMFIPHTWGWVGAGAPYMLWVLAALTGLLVLMWRSSAVIRGAFWSDSAAFRGRQRFHRLWLSLTAASAATVAVLYAALAFPGALPVVIEQWAISLSGAVAMIPPLALPFAGLIVLDVDATLAINRWSLPMESEDPPLEEDEIFVQWRGATPARRLSEQLERVADRYDLERAETPEGWALSGAVGGHTLRLQVEQARLPPRLQIKVDIPGLNPRFPGLWLRPRAAAPDAPPIDDLIFDRTVAVGGAAPEVIHALIDGLHDDLLSVLGEQSDAAVVDGQVQVTLLWEAGSRRAPDWLIGRVSDAVALARSLQSRLESGKSRANDQPMSAGVLAHENR